MIGEGHFVTTPVEADTGTALVGSQAPVTHGAGEQSLFQQLISGNPALGRQLQQAAAELRIVNENDILVYGRHSAKVLADATTKVLEAVKVSDMGELGEIVLALSEEARQLKNTKLPDNISWWQRKLYDVFGAKVGAFFSSIYAYIERQQGMLKAVEKVEGRYTSLVASARQSIDTAVQLEEANRASMRQLAIETAVLELKLELCEAEYEAERESLEQLEAQGGMTPYGAEERLGDMRSIILRMHERVQQMKIMLAGARLNQPVVRGMRNSYYQAGSYLEQFLNFGLPQVRLSLAIILLEAGLGRYVEALNAGHDGLAELVTRNARMLDMAQGKVHDASMRTLSLGESLSRATDLIADQILKGAENVREFRQKAQQTEAQLVKSQRLLQAALKDAREL